VNLVVVPHLSSQGNERHRAPLPQGASHQRCQFHYAKNRLGMAGFDERAELAEGLRGIFAAPNREQLKELRSQERAAKEVVIPARR
jgi:transposase-like protein